MTSVCFSPVAGCHGVASPDAQAYDRRWLFVDANGQWISDPSRLGRIEVGIRFGHLVLKAPGMLRLDIPLDVIEDDDSVRQTATIGGRNVDVVTEGEVAATWATACLGMPGRLVKIHPEAGQIHWPDA